MYQPNYSLTNQIVQNIVDLEVNKSKLTDLQISSRNLEQLQVKTKSMNMFHYAHMIGVDLTLKDAEKVVEGKSASTDDARGVILNNLKSIQDFIEANSNTSFIDIDLKTTVHINKLLLTSWKEDWDVKFRSFEEPANSFLDDWLVLLDKDIPLNMIQNELITLFEWYSTTSNQIPSIIRIAAFLYRFIQISPFIFLNKLTAVGMLQLLLLKNQYLDHTYLSIIRNIDIYSQEFYDSMLHATNNQNDITIWIERFTYYFAKEIKATYDEVTKLTISQTKTNKQPFLNLNKRQLKILRYLQTIPTVKREDFVQMMEVSTMTAFRDLSDLLEKKLIKIEGKGRATKYMLASR